MTSSLREQKIVQRQHKKVSNLNVPITEKKENKESAEASKKGMSSQQDLSLYKRALPINHAQKEEKNLFFSFLFFLTK